MNVYQLKVIKRYNNIPTISDETLAEHMYFTSFMILRSKELLEVDVRIYSKLLEYSLLHDIPELFTGDLPHDLKQREPLIKEILDPMETQIMLEKFDIDLGEYKSLKSLFKTFDLLQVVQYCEYELLLGTDNKDIERIREHAIDLAKEYFDRSKDAFKDHVEFIDLFKETVKHNIKN